jgi:hypothetical protein
MHGAGLRLGGGGVRGLTQNVANGMAVIELVMPGLVPGIHVLARKKGVDGRVI